MKDSVWITTNCGQFLEISVLDHLACLLRNLYLGQEATVRTRHGTMDWFQIGKGVHHGCILSPCLFNFCAEYIIWNTRLDEPATNWKYQQPQIWASLVAQIVKNLPAMQGTQVQSQGRVKKIPWRREWQPTPVFLPGEFHGQEEPGKLQSMGSQRVRHDWATNTFFHLQICRCYHSNSRKWRGTKEPFDEGEKGEWQSWFRTQHWKN